MSDVHYTGNGTGVQWKYSPHEEKMYVNRYSTDHDQIAERAQKIRNEGGTKEKGGFRLVATIPEEVFVAANSGFSHDGKYKGFLNCDHEMQQKMLSKFFLEEDIKIFLTNDNYRI
jgi:ferredoxin-like protein FixX